MPFDCGFWFGLNFFSHLTQIQLWIVLLRRNIHTDCVKRWIRAYIALIHVLLFASRHCFEHINLLCTGRVSKSENEAEQVMSHLLLHQLFAKITLIFLLLLLTHTLLKPVSVIMMMKLMLTICRISS